MNIAEQVAAESVGQIGLVIHEMSRRGLPSEFLVSLMRYAPESAALREMMNIWLDGEDGEDRDETVVHLDEMLAELVLADRRSEQLPKIDFDTLEACVLPAVLEHKRRLREIVDQHGGVSEVARRAGIPQPSLSRMLNDASRPRHTTLHKIARALGLDAAHVVAEWCRE